MTVTYDMSMSLDGCITGPNRRPDQPLGDGGDQLHHWAFGEDEANRAYFAEAASRLGAVITGRRNYNDSIPWWGADGPTGAARIPVVVVTHQAPVTPPDNGVYHFVTDGITAALDQAVGLANGKDVTVMGGPDIGNQFLQAGLIDEISIHLVPVLLGSGTPMFATIDRQTQLEALGTVATPTATHLTYRVLSRS
jgi:dihydrofolate reductase